MPVAGEIYIVGTWIINLKWTIPGDICTPQLHADFRGCACHNLMQTTDQNIGADFAKNANKQAKKNSLSDTVLAYSNGLKPVCFKMGEKITESRHKHRSDVILL